MQAQPRANFKTIGQRSRVRVTDAAANKTFNKKEKKNVIYIVSRDRSCTQRMTVQLSPVVAGTCIRGDETLLEAKFPRPPLHVYMCTQRGDCKSFERKVCAVDGLRKSVYSPGRV